jgi:hypothetical protein
MNMLYEFKNTHYIYGKTLQILERSLNLVAVCIQHHNISKICLPYTLGSKRIFNLIAKDSIKSRHF